MQSTKAKSAMPRSEERGGFTIRVRVKGRRVVITGREHREEIPFATHAAAVEAVERALAGAREMLAEGRVESIDVRATYRRVG